jgi:peptidoglycan hydrolase CwlO-like protein
MERHISGLFQAIPNNTKLEEASFEEKMRKITQALVKYKEQIKELEERVVPRTPPVVQ